MARLQVGFIVRYPGGHGNPPFSFLDRRNPHADPAEREHHPLVSDLCRIRHRLRKGKRLLRPSLKLLSPFLGNRTHLAYFFRLKFKLEYVESALDPEVEILLMRSRALK